MKILNYTLPMALTAITALATLAILIMILLISVGLLHGKEEDTVTVNNNSNDLAKLHIATIQADSCVEDVVRILAKQGEICKVFGHNWRGGRPGEGDNFIFLDYHPNINYRTCTICGKCESQSLDWK